ncbi:class I adenylate-forming enzyme family protein [Allorhizocola rhizosphaerae]|uniref:class I adenylate-forming enzyme family protein n=1 Tax=Allorhizocola rhizosphaerae TaxID=1872709 RepID=UPI000E3C975D|nr:AMP-binding protein [Allorhizocola rhizosphaerae]
MNLATLLREHATRTPDAVALLSRQSSWTWADLDALVDRAAGALLASGVTKVAIALPNTIDFVVALLGAFRAGVIAVPVNPGFTERELRHVLDDSGATLLESYDFSGAPVPAEFPEVADEQLAVLLYTSGTEGAPKGAMLTHRALIANHRQLARIEPPIMSANDVVLLVLPLFHAYGLNSGLGAVLWHGACGVLEPEFDPVGTAGLIALHKVTVAVGVPPMYLAWSELPNARELLASLRLAVCGAAALSAADSTRFTEVTGIAVHIGYGLTETAPVVSSTLASKTIKPGSIGRPIPGVEVKLLGEEDDPGEIVVRGDNLFNGYWPDGRGGPGADGWWATGDIAYADSGGDLFIVDRIGELIIVNGFNVYPAEVEQVLAAHPGVAEAAAIGVPHPSSGHAVHAYVVGTAPVEELMAHCAANLARFKCPQTIEIVDELPHSATGKVRKRLLRDD